VPWRAQPNGQLMVEQVSLRSVTDDDLPIFYEQQFDPQAVQMAAFPPRAREAFMRHWDKIRSNPNTLLRTITCEGQVAGYMLSFVQDGVREVGYWLGREFWGRGIATRALAAFLDQVEPRPLYAHVAKHNAGSRRVLEKCGFVLHGENPEFATIDGVRIEGWILRLAG
jgi:RimJ/RimL family protein N-acetyltransferase